MPPYSDKCYDVSQDLMFSAPEKTKFKPRQVPAFEYSPSSVDAFVAIAAEREEQISFRLLN